MSLAANAQAYSGAGGPRSGPGPLADRAAAARAKCLGPGYAKPPVTFEQPKGEWESHYRQSYLQEALVGVYKPLILHFGGYLQGALAGGDVPRVSGTLANLGRELKATAHERGYDPYESICLVGCVVNELLSAETDPLPNASIDFAVGEGFGDCKHFASVGKILLDEMGVKSKFVVSLDHAFGRTKINGAIYDFDLLWGTEPWCNFMKPVN